MEDMREGCIRIAENIEGLTEDAMQIASLNEEIFPHHRVGWLLVIHSIDETGRLIKMLKASAIAERGNCDVVEIAGYKSHPDKGKETGAALHVAVEWFEGVFDEMAKTYGLGEYNLDQYRSHLEVLRLDFHRVRLQSIYVERTDDKWMVPFYPGDVCVWLDAWAMHVLAIMVRAHLEAKGPEKSFRDLEDTVTNLHKSSRMLKELWKEKK